MDRELLVLNSGSSSLKFAVYREIGEAGLQVAPRRGPEVMPRFAMRSGDDAELGSHAWPSVSGRPPGFAGVAVAV